MAVQERVRHFFQNKTNVALVVVLLGIIIGALIFIPKVLNRAPSDLPEQEVEMLFDPNGPYAILDPRRDGNAIILNINRVNGYEKIAYELAYQSQTNPGESDEGGEAIDRGVQGEVTVEDEQKSEYTQEILFGTCSKGDTFSTLHCVFDKGVENGTLVLKITPEVKPGDKVKLVNKMVTTWHLQKPDVALGVITSADEHFSYTTKATRTELANVGFTMVNELSGAPKIPDGKAFVGKVYAFNVPTAKTFPAGEVMIEMAESATPEMQLARYDFGSDSWQMLETKANGSTLSAQVEGNGIFAVLKNSD